MAHAHEALVLFIKACIMFRTTTSKELRLEAQGFYRHLAFGFAIPPSPPAFLPSWHPNKTAPLPRFFSC